MNYKKRFEENKEEFISFYKEHSREETAIYFNISSSAVDRWKKKLHILRRTFQYRNVNVEFTKEQMDIIIGSMLGDGSLTYVGRNGRKNACFAEVHSGDQYDFLEWKMNKLFPISKPITSKLVNGRKIVDGNVVADLSKKLTSCRLQTIVHPLLTELEFKWYQRDGYGEYILDDNKKRFKIVPNDLILNENIIAIWYFDDGSNNAKGRYVTFNTQSFKKETVDILAEKLRKFGFHCGVCKNRSQYVIQINSKSYLDIIDLAKSRLPCECMAYKVDLSKYKSPNLLTRFQPKKNEKL